MALIQCKECGEQISDKAEICPKCGFKQPKKTSIFTWLVVLAILLGILGNLLPSSDNVPSTTQASNSAQSSSSYQAYIENDSLFCSTEEQFDEQMQWLVQGQQQYVDGCAATMKDIPIIILEGGGIGVTKARGIDSKQIYWVNGESIKFK